MAFNDEKPAKTDNLAAVSAGALELSFADHTSFQDSPWGNAAGSGLLPRLSRLT